MVHPQYKAAKNQYAQRTNVKLSKESRQTLKDRMIEFNKRFASIM
tara:strand:- start:230 stop:364 length:135 start_codon:yes stop_codon:yes gene_type:complete